MLGKPLTIKEIAAILRVGNGEKDTENGMVDRIATDSRYEGLNDRTLFFALRTGRDDGHKYIDDARKKGVRYFVVEGSFKSQEGKGEVFFRTENTLNALQNLASHHRDLLRYPLIGITGSNGKTITKEWLFQLLSLKGLVEKSPKSYNSQIGVPLSLLGLQTEASKGIVEAGISKPGEMTILQEMIRPEWGIITNIHGAHLENFSSKNELALEKLKLFSSCKKIFYRADYSEIVEGLHTLPPNCEKIAWTKDHSRHDAIHVDWHSNGKSTNVVIHHPMGEYSFDLPFVDEASAENAVFAVLVAMEVGIDKNLMKPVLKSLPSVAMRLEQLAGINNCTLVNDTYNSDLTSLEIALQFLKMQKQHDKRTLILSDIYHTGKTSNELYSTVDELCKKYGVNRLIGIGKEISSSEVEFSMDVSLFESTSAFLDHLGSISFFEEAILIKGSRSFGFERISRQLESKKHETLLEVNLSAMIENLNFYRSQLKPGTKLMVMVKAFSYGTGSFEVANVLQHHQVDYLAVAYIDEGVALRKSGITMPIMVLNPSFGSLDELLENKLEPEIYTLSALQLVAGYLKNSKKTLKVHLKLETGMHRLGLDAEDIPKVCEILKSEERIEVASVMSHLVGSDNQQLDDFTILQAGTFVKLAEEIGKSTKFPFLRHIANSDGIIRFPQYHFDMVRLGIGLYGISSMEDIRYHLHPVIQVKTVVSQLKRVKKGESIGYNRNFIAAKDTLSATLPIGYADGLPRSLGNGNWTCLVNGTEVPIIGNICMDMCFLDVSEVPDIREKDEVSVLARPGDIYEMAKQRNTIPYEVLTSFSERIKRVFYYGD